jgi:hypothetical protein
MGGSREKICSPGSRIAILWRSVSGIIALVLVFTVILLFVVSQSTTM